LVRTCEAVVASFGVRAGQSQLGANRIRRRRR
jgi:hypothetical protein